MKALLSVVALAVLAGCATSPGGDQVAANDLRKPLYLRHEQMLALTFPQIQMALIKHQRVCGTAPVFAMKDGETSYASITQKNDPAGGWDKTILIDLMAYQANWRQEARSKTEVFSLYGGKQVDERIRSIYAAITNPDVCPGAEEPVAKD